MECFSTSALKAWAVSLARCGMARTMHGQCHNGGPLPVVYAPCMLRANFCHLPTLLHHEHILWIYVHDTQESPAPHPMYSRMYVPGGGMLWLLLVGGMPTDRQRLCFSNMN